MRGLSLVLGVLDGPLHEVVAMPSSRMSPSRPYPDQAHDIPSVPAAEVAVVELGHPVKEVHGIAIETMSRSGAPIEHPSKSSRTVRPSPVGDDVAAPDVAVHDPRGSAP